MHSKQKGDIGEASVIKSLLMSGYPVFTEFGDLSKIDVITIVDTKLVRIQVKNFASQPNAGCFCLSIRKNGPGYRYVYTESDVDVFACYIAAKDCVVYIGWKDLQLQNQLHIRYEPSKNGNAKLVHWYEDFLSIENALTK